MSRFQGVWKRPEGDWVVVTIQSRRDSFYESETGLEKTDPSMVPTLNCKPGIW